MNYRLPIVAAALVACAGCATLWMFQHSKSPEKSRPRTSATARQLLTQLPMWFESLPGGRFAAKSMGQTVLLNDRSAEWKMRGGSTIRMAFKNANPAPVLHGVDRLTARFDRYKGNQPRNWQSNIPAYGKVAYDAVYPGIDLVYYGKGNHMEHDFIVAPQADPKQIRLTFEGASSVQLDAQGNLNLESGADKMALTKPVAYQRRANGDRAEVPVQFATASDRTVGFAVGAYDSSLPLVIDPVVVYSTYLGGNGEDELVSVAVDLKSDSVWVVGSTDSSDLQTNNGGTLNGASPSAGRDVLVARFIGAASGQITIAYSSLIGGTGSDEPAAIAVAPNGIVYITGSTGSADFPSVSPYKTSFQGVSDAFVIGIDGTKTDSSALVYSTFLGGTAADHATAMTIDPNNFVYVAGYTTSTDFPTSSGAILSGNRGGFDPFVVKLDPTAGASGLVYGTTYGGSSTDEATGVAVDATGVIYLSGWTYSTDFPTSVGVVGSILAPSYIGQGDLFLVGIDPTKSGNDGIVFCTYLGGSGYDQATAMQFAPNGNLYIAGVTLSTDFPVVGNAPQRRNAGNADMFLMALDFKKQPSDWIVFSTYLGGTGDDVPFGMAIDPNGRVNLIGYTHPLSAIPSPTSKAFPTTASAVQPVSGGLEEAVIARIDPSLPAEQALVFSTYWGGPYNDIGLGIAADPRGCLIYATGTTSSPNLLVATYAFQGALATGPDAFLINIDTCTDPAPPLSESRRRR